MNTPKHEHELVMLISLSVNGSPVTHLIPVRRSLADFLRLDLGLTGTHLGCEQGACGACSVSVDGVLLRACLMLAVQAHETQVVTVEGLSESRVGQALQDAFFERAALQCGFCTPGMLATAVDLLAHCAQPSRDQIREHLAGNYCRCTGFQSIVDSVELAAARLGSEASG